MSVSICVAVWVCVWVSVGVYGGDGVIQNKKEQG